MDGDFTVLGDCGLNKTVRIADSLSVGFVSAEGRFGQTGSLFDIYGERRAQQLRLLQGRRVGIFRAIDNHEHGAVRLLPQVISDPRTV